MSEKERCELCRFYLAAPAEAREEAGPQGLCRRWPPRPKTLNGDTRTREAAVFSAVFATDWCGEFADAAPPSPQENPR